MAMHILLVHTSSMVVEHGSTTMAMHILLVHSSSMVVENGSMVEVMVVMHISTGLRQFSWQHVLLGLHRNCVLHRLCAQ